MLAEALILYVVPAALIAAAIYDAASFTIPNRIQILLLGAFPVFALFALSPEAAGMHVLAGFIGLAIGFTLFALGYIGGGDAKLFACVALWLGISDLLDYALIASVLGGFLTLGLLAMRSMPLPQLLAHQSWIMRLHDERAGVPYGIALAAGALALLPYTDVFRIGLAA